MTTETKEVREKYDVTIQSLNSGDTDGVGSIIKRRAMLEEEWDLNFIQKMVKS